MSGTLNTLSATSLPPREAIEFFLGKTNIPTSGWSDVWQEAHSRAFMVAGAASQDLLADFSTSIARAQAQGTTLADFRRDFREIVAKHGWEHNGTPGWRAQIIYETNLSMAYSAGRYAQLTEPETLGAFPFWQYVHSGAAHPRLQHKAWNGLTLRADDPFWSTHYPPNGWKCGCRVRPLSARDLGRQGKSGPDQAPPIVTRPWRRPSDGQVLQVPEGIDPGFAYNVGEAWRGHGPITPGDARLTPPAGWVPPVPGGALPDTPRFATTADADAVLRPAYRAWADRLSRVQQDAISRMRTGLRPRLNRFLENQDDWDYGSPEAPADAVKALDFALDVARAPRALRVFRSLVGSEARQLAHLGVGDQMTTRTYLSTSAIAEVPAAVQDALRVEIIVPEGMRGVAYVGAGELLLRRRLAMTVVHREPGRIVLRVTGTPTVQALE